MLYFKYKLISGFVKKLNLHARSDAFVETCKYGLILILLNIQNYDLYNKTYYFFWNTKYMLHTCILDISWLQFEFI